MAQPCAFSATLAPPMVNTPGSVQPGNGMTRSIAPVASMIESNPDPLDAGRAERLGVATLDVPDQRAGPIVDSLPQVVENRMHGLRLARLEAVKRRSRSPEPFRRPAIDLAAAARAFVNDDRRKAAINKSLGRPRSRRAGADDQHAGIVAAHDPSSSAHTRMPSSTSIVQARVRLPSSNTTQQSWHAPILQNPARKPPSNSLRRSPTPLQRSAVNSVSPASASSGRPP